MGNDESKEDTLDNEFETYAVGDCVKSRDIKDAIWEGFRTARLV